MKEKIKSMRAIGFAVAAFAALVASPDGAKGASGIEKSEIDSIIESALNSGDLNIGDSPGPEKQTLSAEEQAVHMEINAIIEKALKGNPESSLSQRSVNHDPEVERLIKESIGDVQVTETQAFEGPHESLYDDGSASLEGEIMKLEAELAQMRQGIFVNVVGDPEVRMREIENEVASLKEKLGTISE